MFTGLTKAGVDDDSYHFVGIQVAEAEAFADLPAGKPAESTGDLYPRLARSARGSVRAHICEGEFFDIGTAGDYMRTARVLSAREQRPNSGAGIRVDSTADVRESILWDNVTVHSGARLEQCIVTDDVVVPAGSTWRQSALRRADGTLHDREERIGDLAVAPLG